MKLYKKGYCETHTTEGIDYEIECVHLFTNKRNDLWCKLRNQQVYTPGLYISEQPEKPCWSCPHNAAFYEETKQLTKFTLIYDVDGATGIQDIYLNREEAEEAYNELRVHPYYANVQLIQEEQD